MSSWKANSPVFESCLRPGHQSCSSSMSFWALVTHPHSAGNSRYAEGGGHVAGTGGHVHSILPPCCFCGSLSGLRWWWIWTVRMWEAGAFFMTVMRVVSVLEYPLRDNFYLVWLLFKVRPEGVGYLREALWDSKIKSFFSNMMLVWCCRIFTLRGISFKADF